MNTETKYGDRPVNSNVHWSERSDDVVWSQSRQGLSVRVDRCPSVGLKRVDRQVRHSTGLGQPVWPQQQAGGVGSGAVGRSSGRSTGRRRRRAVGCGVAKSGAGWPGRRRRVGRQHLDQCSGHCHLTQVWLYSSSVLCVVVVFSLSLSPLSFFLFPSLPSRRS